MNFSLEFIINVVVLLAQLYLGLIVILQNPKSFTNRFFLGLVLFMAIQGVVQSFVVTTNISINFDVQSRLSISLVPIQLLFLLLFLTNFPDSKPKIKTGYLGLLFLIILTLTALGNTHLVFEGFKIEDGLAKAQAGPIFPIFTVALILLVLINIALIFIKYRKVSSKNKVQIIIVGIGIALTFLGLLSTQYILPNFYGNAEFLNFISLFTLPLLIATSYAVLGFRIFDVRLVSAEVFTLLTWVLFFVAFFFRPTDSGPEYPIIIIILLIFMGILLTRNITNEVKRRTRLEELAEELKKINIELRKAKEELEKLSKFKSEMLSLASHQIKAPLATIKGFASIITDGLYGEINPKVKETVTKMRSSADDLINLINTLLDLRRVEEGKMEYKFERVKLKNIIAEVIEILQFSAQDKKIELSFKPSTDAEVNVDSQKIKQVVQNLIDNAIKYTPQGYVRVGLEEGSFNDGNRNGAVIFSVIDSGLGIPKDLLPQLFSQEFVRDERFKKQILGTGLGLYIAQKIVTDHGGKIWAESDGEGRGSRFFVKLRKI